MPFMVGKLQDGKSQAFLGSENLALYAIIVLTLNLGFVAIFLFRNAEDDKKTSPCWEYCCRSALLPRIFYVADYKKS
jgi:hypothetical protein